MRNSSGDEIANVKFFNDEFGEITQNKGHCAVQGHLGLPILVPNKSSCTTSY